MDVFIAKITNRENVDHILNQQEFTHIGINILESQIKQESLVFLVFSGDKKKIDWKQGLIGYGHVTKEPYEKGYDPSKKNNYKINIKPKFVLKDPLSPKFTKLHPKYQSDLYDVPYVGANHFPNQAIAKASGKSAYALFHLFEDVSPGSTSSIGIKFKINKDSATIKDEFRDFLSSKNQASTVSSYINALDQMPNFLDRINQKCPFVWDENVNTELLEEAANFVKCESLKDGGGKLNSYVPKSHWNNGWFYSGINNYIKFLKSKTIEQTFQFETKIINTYLPKPFILLAGISGTGKTRFVRDQARRSNGCSADYSGKLDNYELIAVRPDWHEPSDLLGYVSRISGEKYVQTEFLSFLIKAWEEVFSKGGSLTEVKEQTRPFWLCLDEMNLAPVEQYFADYLSILESRKWTSSGYSSLSIISGKELQLLSNNFDRTEPNEMWDAFVANDGIPLPPNLIVAGTVNMDETTHGFSRKVIDRALTLDFQEFFPNKYDEFFDQKTEPRLFSFPISSQISSAEDLSIVKADPDGSKTIEFLSAINEKLKSTPFELAYRALNELLLSIKCAMPEDDKTLVAVWDDFLMQKVLPRIDGDAEKLHYTGDDESGLLNELKELINSIFKKHLEDKDGTLYRPDLLNQNKDGTEPEQCHCKSLEKIQWMQDRLIQNQYTSFWA